MATRDAVLSEAERWIGVSEQGRNNVPGVTDWYGLRGAWCAMWISRVFFNAGMPIPAQSPKGFAWVSAGFDWMRRQGWHMFTDWREAQPGDLIAWEWNQTAGGYDHISMVWQPAPRFVTIGGNESDRVKFEPFAGAPRGAVLFARPPYDPPPTPSEEDDMPAAVLVLDPDGSGWWECFTGCPDRRHVNTPFGPAAELDPLKWITTAGGGQVLDENTPADQRRFWMYARNPVVTGGQVDPKAIAEQVIAALGQSGDTQALARAVADELHARLSD